MNRIFHTQFPILDLDQCGSPCPAHLRKPRPSFTNETGASALTNAGATTSNDDLGDAEIGVAGARPYLGKGLAGSIAGEHRPSERFGLFGRIGLLAWQAEQTLDTNTGRLTANEPGLDLVIGFGAQWHPSQSLALRGEWARYALDNRWIEFPYLALSYDSWPLRSLRLSTMNRLPYRALGHPLQGQARQ